MILFELFNSENHPVYQELQVSNGNRHYDFLRSVVLAALNADRRFLSQHVIRALNFHAIACLHVSPGEYRPCPVKVGNYTPPEHYRVPALMDDFVNSVNRLWETADPVVLASFVLWRMNHIHPFINGNGRTARAAAYFVLCIKLGGWLRGDTILPELLRQNRDAYVAALQQVDASLASGELNLAPLHALVTQLLDQQLATAPDTTDPANGSLSQENPEPESGPDAAPPA